MGPDMRSAKTLSSRAVPIWARTPRRLLGAAMAVLGVALLVVPTALSSTVSAAPTEVDFGPLGVEQTFTVPADVHSIDVTLVGARGGDNNNASATGGKGAEVTATIDVTPGDVLYVEVGG